MTLLERSTERAVKEGQEAVFFGLGFTYFIATAEHPACGVGAKILGEGQIDMQFKIFCIKATGDTEQATYYQLSDHLINDLILRKFCIISLLRLRISS